MLLAAQNGEEYDEMEKHRISGGSVQLGGFALAMCMIYSGWISHSCRCQCYSSAMLLPSEMGVAQTKSKCLGNRFDSIKVGPLWLGRTREARRTSPGQSKRVFANFSSSSGQHTAIWRVGFCCSYCGLGLWTDWFFHMHTPPRRRRRWLPVSPCNSRFWGSKML